MCEIPARIIGRAEMINPRCCKLTLADVADDKLTLRIDDASNDAAWLEVILDAETIHELAALLDPTVPTFADLDAEWGVID